MRSQLQVEVMHCEDYSTVSRGLKRRIGWLLLGAAARSRDSGGGSKQKQVPPLRRRCRSGFGRNDRGCGVAVAPASVGMTGDVGSLSLRLRPEFQGMCGGCCTGFGQRTAVEDD